MISALQLSIFEQNMTSALTRKSVLFVHPDYHNSFFIRDALRSKGWKADIYRSGNYPPLLLYRADCITDNIDATAPLSLWGRLQRLWKKTRFFYSNILKYKYFVIYGTPYIYSFIPGRISLWLERHNICFELALLKFLGKKIIYEPSGCKEEALQSDYRQHCPNLCANCGSAKGLCNDDDNRYSFNIRNKYGDASLAVIPQPFNRIKNHQQIRYKCLDLELWHPDIIIPEEHKLPHNGKIRIMHSFVDNERLHEKRNIKGSPFIAEAIEKLKNEGYPVEYFYVRDIPSKDMRYYQAQSDIIVEQLIYGWWGSTGVETMALGKPVVCYIHPEWKELFFKLYPQYDSLPIVEASTDTIYDALKKLVEDSSYRQRCAEASRQFAEMHFDVEKNVGGIEELLESL